MLRKSLSATLVLSALYTLACSANPATSSGVVGSAASNGSGESTGSAATGATGSINPSGGGGTTGIIVGTDPGLGGSDGNAPQQCDGKFKGYLRDFTIGDAMGNVIANGSSAPGALTKWWQPGAV